MRLGFHSTLLHHLPRLGWFHALSQLRLSLLRARAAHSLAHRLHNPAAMIKNFMVWILKHGGGVDAVVSNPDRFQPVFPDQLRAFAASRIIIDFDSDSDSEVEDNVVETEMEDSTVVPAPYSPATYDPTSPPYLPSMPPAEVNAQPNAPPPSSIIAPQAPPTMPLPYLRVFPDDYPEYKVLVATASVISALEWLRGFAVEDGEALEQCLLCKRGRTSP
eukprot:CAMPEP_0119298862 /NCGR_PEP_ID=MMETSP1333-20130426/992_1 /TAXON_ID=418940 /ORGANISM="Scyphosphaera apsteinii, Strain RCC1455" /LENGTH=217 /DNA_ID=CAMNT_0007300079 /DNA_START=150 /DNA_END=803 /DNA_ORIENTATION=+